MRKLRHIVSAAAVAAAALTATPAVAQQASPTRQATATARIVKPLTIEWVSDLDLGNVILNAGTYSNVPVGITHANVPTCDSNLTCTGTMTRAAYRVTGTNGQTVKINAGTSLTLTNQNGPGTLSLAVSNPGTVLLGNSGTTGVVFYLGGSLAVSSTTADGTYTGTFAVNVEYN